MNSKLPVAGGSQDTGSYQVDVTERLTESPCHDEWEGIGLDC